ncbi:MAG: DUF1801 domain-containing protein [Parvularculaceae bacterium]
MTKPPSVDEYLAGLSHKRLADIKSVREIVLKAVPSLTEHIKWNAPSFCWNGEDRITMRLQPGDRLELIFHRGAKVRDASTFSFDDPTGRLEWAARDRAVLRVSDLKNDRSVIKKLVKAWLAAR